jgi:hypothetical protein
MTTEKYKCIAQPMKGMMFTIGKEYNAESYKSYYTLLDNNGVRCSFYHEEFYRLFTAVEPTTMTIEKYKCIALPISFEKEAFTIGKEYEVRIVNELYEFGDYPNRVLSNKGYEVHYSNDEFNRCFQKVEPNKNKFLFNYPPKTNNQTTTQPMKYKVTITSSDHTGHEDEKEVYENVSQNDFFSLLGQNRGKRVLIEPMPEKKKVRVYLYIVIDGNDYWTVSKAHIDSLEIARKKDISNGLKVSEIKSMEVEI